MAHCSNCGAEVSGTQSYCSKCGSELDLNEANGQDGVGDVSNGQANGNAGESRNARQDSFDVKHAILAVAIGLIPAFGLYVMTSVALFDPIPAVLLIGIVVFGYLLYRQPTIKAMFGGASFWLAVESFLTPLALLVYTFSFAAEEAGTGAEQAGAAIGGGLLILLAFVIAVPLGIVFYLVSGKLSANEGK